MALPMVTMFRTSGWIAGGMNWWRNPSLSMTSPTTAVKSSRRVCAKRSASSFQKSVISLQRSMRLPGHHVPAAADEKVQIGACVGLQDVVEVQALVAAGHRGRRRPPAGASALEFFVRYI